jgi:hypothetical protein
MIVEVRCRTLKRRLGGMVAHVVEDRSEPLARREITHLRLQPPARDSVIIMLTSVHAMTLS